MPDSKALYTLQDRLSFAFIAQHQPLTIHKWMSMPVFENTFPHATPQKTDNRLSFLTPVLVHILGGTVCEQGLTY